MNPEQLTQVVNELRDANEAMRQELARRAQEHQGQHNAVDEMRRRMAEMESRLSAENRGGGTTQFAFNNEVAKRLDRWATSTSDAPFHGPEGKTGLHTWIRDMKEQAAYCSEPLRVAMDRAERMAEPVTGDHVDRWHIDTFTDRALRMAVFGKKKRWNSSDLRRKQPNEKSRLARPRALEGIGCEVRPDQCPGGPGTANKSHARR